MAASETAAAEAPKATVVSKGLEEVVVHPLVLLSVVDHFRRIEEVRSSPPPRPLPRGERHRVCVGYHLSPPRGVHCRCCLLQI